ncbi:hypothetical protein ACFL20_10450 [Spirochaetota bacterium]
MPNNNRFIIEQENNEGANRVLVEQHAGENDLKNWNAMKDGIGKNVVIFTNSFFRSLIPAFLIFLIITVLIFLEIFF